MKKLLQAAVLVILASSAILAAATSRHSRANANLPYEWEQKVTISADSLKTLQAISHSIINKK